LSNHRAMAESIAKRAYDVAILRVPRPEDPRVGEFTFMKIQRTLAALWLAGFIAGPCYWLWMFLNKSAPAYDGIHAWQSLVCLYGIVATIFLFQGAKWARISLVAIALVFGVGAFFGEILPQGWMRADKLADDATFVLSGVTVVLLFFRQYEPVTNTGANRRRCYEASDSSAEFGARNSFRGL
jgi:hypothetical protein